jgi:hypothetical protein
MGTSKYLDSVLKILPGVQARQISELLKSLQASGQIKNAGEYEAKLRQLAMLVNSSTPVPSFQQIRAIVWGLCSSDAHNAMMTAIKNDVEASFIQVDEIGSRLDDHNVLFMKNVLSDLENNLAEQENTIRRLEWLADQTNEFTQSLVNTFSSTSLLTVNRSEVGSDNLYYDNRTYKTQNSTELPSAVISTEGRKLLLDVDSDPMVKPIEVVMHSDSYSYTSEVQVDIHDNVSNIIDGTSGTYWSKNVYLSSKVPKVSTVLEFLFGSGRDLNYLIVEGGSEEPFYVEKIEGVSPDGYRIDLLSDYIEINRTTRIDFPRTLVKSVLITFSTYTFHRAEYFTNRDTSVHDAFDPSNKYERLLRRDWMNPVVRDALASENIATSLNVPVTPIEQIEYYRYTTTLDNVWFGNSQYRDVGVFVSKPLKVSNLGILAVRTIEGQTDVGNIEYEIIKRDTSPKVKEVRFSIPKMSQTTVTNERLILFKRESSVINDVGMLRFCPYISSAWTNILPDPFVVYENGVALDIKTGYQVKVGSEWRDTFNDLLDFNEYTISPPKLYIKINSPKISSIYTVSYTIRTSETKSSSDSLSNTVWLDEDKTISLYSDGRVHIRPENPDTIVESDIYLQVTLRRNTSTQSSSPELYEYAILSSSYA